MFFERVDDLVRVAHGPAGGVAQFVELLLVFVFVGGHAVGPGVTIGTSSMRITPVTSAGHRNRSGRNMPPTRPASTARANMISRTVAVPGTRAAIENTYSASTATDNTAQDAAITGCPEDYLDAVAEELNDRPRKTLGFMKPSEKIIELLDAA